MLGTGRARSRIGAGVPASPGHRGEGRADVGRRSVGEPGVHRDGGEEVRVRGPQDRGHGAAGGHPRHEDAASVDRRRRSGPHELADDRGDRRRLAGAARLVPRREPVPAALGVARALLLRIDDAEAVAVGGFVHARRGREARGVLGAPVEHADERTGGPGLDARGGVDDRAERPSGHDGPLLGRPADVREPGSFDHRAIRCVQLAPIHRSHLRTISIVRVRNLTRQPRRHEAAVHAQQRRPLRLAQLGVAQDRSFRLAQRRLAVVGVLEHPHAREQRPERHAERRGDRPQHAQRRLVETPLELAEIGVRDLRPLRELPQRQVRGDPLRAQQGTEQLELFLPGFAAHGHIFAQRRTARDACSPRGSLGTAWRRRR